MRVSLSIQLKTVFFRLVALLIRIKTAFRITKTIARATLTLAKQILMVTAKAMLAMLPQQNLIRSPVQTKVALMTLLIAEVKGWIVS